MLDKIKIDPKDLENAFLDSKKYLDQSRVYDPIISNESRKEPEIILGSLEKFIGTYIAVRNTLESTNIFKDIGDFFTREAFIDTYSMYIGAIEGLACINKADISINSKGKNLFGKSFDFRKYEYDKEIRKKLVINSALDKYVSVTKEMSPTIQLGSTYNFFEWIAEQAIKGKNEYEDFEDIAEKIHLQVNSSTFNGFNYFLAEKEFGKEKAKKTKEISDKLSTDIGNICVDSGVDLEDIAGNIELKKKLKRGIENILTFNTEKKANILTKYTRLPSAYYVVGEPGTGKTLTFKAIAAYGEKIASANKIPFTARHITSSTFKSEYFAKSAKNLFEIFSDMQESNRPYFLVIEDFDTIFFSRENSKTEENKSILGELLQLLEGISTQNRGNYIVAVSTNKELDSDSALIQRLKENIIHVKGPETAEDYINVYKTHLRNSLEELVKISDSEWQEIGEFCFEKHKDLWEKYWYYFSGRDIKNITTAIADSLYNFEKPPGWFSMEDSKRETFILNTIRPIKFRSGGKGLFDLTENYVAKLVGAFEK